MTLNWLFVHLSRILKIVVSIHWNMTVTAIWQIGSLRNCWIDYFWLKNDGEKWSRIFNFKILRAPSEIPANLPG